MELITINMVKVILNKPAECHLKLESCIKFDHVAHLKTLLIWNFLEFNETQFCIEKSSPIPYNLFYETFHKISMNH